MREGFAHAGVLTFEPHPQQCAGASEEPAERAMKDVRLRKRLVLVAAAVLGAAAAVLPAIAASESPAITAVNNGIYYHDWSPSSATVSAGGVVALSNPTAVPHGVEWVGSPPETPKCTGVPVGTNEAASAPKWSGTCTFSTPGTYTFYCTVHHAEMTGTVTVSSTGTTTTTTSTATTPTSTTPAGGPPAPGSAGAGETPTAMTPFPGASSSPLAGVAATAIKIPPRQRGRVVRGSVEVSSAGSGGRLRVELLAARAALATPGKGLVEAGHVLRSALAPGRVSFAVALSARARAALKRSGRLKLEVRVALAGPSSAAVTVTRGVLLRR
jgi:plastocyanin